MERAVGEGCWRGPSERAVGEGYWREPLERAVRESRWRATLTFATCRSAKGNARAISSYRTTAKEYTSLAEE